MSYSLIGALNLSVQAMVDEAGSMAHVNFDEMTWSTLLLAVSPGGWLFRRTVLISPATMCEVDGQSRTISLKPSRQQVKDSPSINMARPVSRQDEGRLLHWGYDITPEIMEINQLEDTDRLAAHARKVQVNDDAAPYFRSSKEVIGDAIQAAGQSNGQIEDFLVDDADFSIGLMVVDIHKW